MDKPLIQNIDPMRERFPLNEAEAPEDRLALAKEYHRNLQDGETISGSALYWSSLQEQLNHVPGMENEEFSAIRSYSGPYAYHINQELRNIDRLQAQENISDSDLAREWPSGSLVADVDTLDQYFENSAPRLTHDAIVERLVDDPQAIFGENIADAVGQTYQEPGFMSTAARYDHAGVRESRIRVTVPQGTPYAAMDAINQDGRRGKNTTTLENPDFLEHEILFGRGHALHVIAAEQNAEGIWEIDCQLQPRIEMNESLRTHPNPDRQADFDTSYEKSRKLNQDVDYEEEFAYAHKPRFKYWQEEKQTFDQPAPKPQLDLPDVKDMEHIFRSEKPQVRIDRPF